MATVEARDGYVSEEPGARDGCIVDTAPLAVVVRGFISSQGLEQAGRRWLAERSGIHEDTIENIAAARSAVTELRVADALLTALERPDLLSDGKLPRNTGGTLEIRPNPRARKDLQASCCSGCGL